MNQFKYCPWDGYRFAEVDQDCFICKRPRFKISNQIEMVPKKQWKKILYQQQDYDDNYIDQSFLSGVVTEDNSSNGPNYKDLINKSSDLIFAINSVVTYLIVFYCIFYEIVRAEIFIGILSMISVIGTITYILLTQKTFRVHEILSNLKSIAVVIGILILFSPVFLTINQTYADNTIYALTTFCIFYHLIARDYDFESSITPSTWKANTSSYASLGFTSLLASRLHDEKEVFVMLFGSLLFFIFAQFLKKSVKVYSLRIFKLFMVISTIMIGVELYILSIMLASIYFLVVFSITFICPLQIIWLFQYKNNITGPWDLPKVNQYE